MDGKKFDYIACNIFLYGEADPDCPKVNLDGFELAKPKLKGIKGKVIISGTADTDSFKSGQPFHKLWSNG